MHPLSRALHGLTWIGMASLLASSSASCSLLVSLDGLSEPLVDEAPSEDGGSGSDAEAAAPSIDARTDDSGAEAEASADAGDTAYRDEVLATKPAGYWRLDEQTGTEAHDQIMNQHPGLYYGGYVLGEPGLPAGGRSVRLNGTSGCIGVGPYFRFAGNTSFSIEAWLKVSALPAFAQIATTEGLPTGTRNGWSLFVADGYPVFEGWMHDGVDNRFVFGAYTNSSKGGLLVVGEWNHVVGTYTANGEEIWVNGVRRDRQSQSSLALKDAGTFTIGCAGSGSGTIARGLSGWLTEVAVYSKVLTEVEITRHYAVGLAR